MDHLSSLLGSEVRAKLLVHFVLEPDSEMGLRPLARRIGVAGKRSLQVEVARLEELGLVQRTAHGREMRISRVPNPEWATLAALVQAYAPAAVLREALAAVPEVEAAFVFGSHARGDARPDSDIDVLVYGDDIPDQALGKALLDASLVLDRTVDAKRYDAATFRRDWISGSAFLPAAMSGPKEWLVGSAADLPPTRKAAA